ncbi:DUF488 family protein [Brevundimonas sp. DC300-4]|uniref:DUF488 domain-containing protein n=1 Tax=Brevundimonas sp. DC300-4 TaxID=2804594 RepID=UPI003CEE56BD
MTIFTIGYEGTILDAFIETLREGGVETVVDVRAVAVSRRRGFSKTALSTRVRAEGMEYVHLRDLGDPKPGREAARAGRWREFESIYAAHLRTAEAQLALAILGRLMANSSVALLCYEADAAGCHRTMIARDVAKPGKSRIVNLVVNNQVASVGQSRAHDHLGESLAAA